MHPLWVKVQRSAFLRVPCQWQFLYPFFSDVNLYNLECIILKQVPNMKYKYTQSYWNWSLGQVFKVVSNAVSHQICCLSIIWEKHVSPNSKVPSANIQLGQECQTYFDCRDQFLLKWRAAINFPSFPEQFQKLKDVQPSKLQFHGLLHWSGSLFSADLFFLSRSFHSSAEFTAVSHYYSVMFHLIFVIWGLTDTLEIQKLKMCMALQICATYQA